MGSLFLQADLLHNAHCNHIRCVHLVSCTTVWFFFSRLARPARAGHWGERTGCHHCCVFKNSLQAAFQITSAANQVIAPQHERAYIPTAKYAQFISSATSPWLATLIGFLSLLFVLTTMRGGALVYHWFVSDTAHLCLQTVYMQGGIACAMHFMFA